jgi:2-(1,2-epoxy-1,2-dihydrophenyl)acetyl-CoA isomerase
MEYSTLLFEVRDNVATITLNRPDAANAMNRELTGELADAALRCDVDPAVRAVLITGGGKMFCPGGDVKEFAAQGDNLHAYITEMAAFLHIAVSRLRRMDPLVIAAVNGVAAGAGMSLAIACDIVLAAESARFTMAYTRVGLSPDGSATYFLPRIVGPKRALELALTNRLLSAQEAADWGIVARVVPDDQLLDDARQLGVQLAAGPTAAFGKTKHLLERAWTETLETQMESEGRVIADSARAADAREGVTAFLEKRPPQFTGE